MWLWRREEMTGSVLRLFWTGLLCAGQRDAGQGLICNAAGDFRVG
jgi:hypothetical protein